SVEEIGNLSGIGPAITAKIQELTTEGKMATLEKWKAKTPTGITEMLGISGFGPKKIRAVWQGLGVQNIGELLYAVNENRLVELKGFGAKTQVDVKQKLEFFQRSSGQYHYRTLEGPAEQLLSNLQQYNRDHRWDITGQFRRRATVLTSIELLTTCPISNLSSYGELESLTVVTSISARAKYQDFPVEIHLCDPAGWERAQFRRTASQEFLSAFIAKYGEEDFIDSKEELGSQAQLVSQQLPPELWEEDWGLNMVTDNSIPTLIEEKDIRGVVHSHSTYSDGINSLQEMAEAAQKQGYGYLLITDHSQSAVYANGLKEERLREQWAEIDQLNASLHPFRILKGIESDILADGSLDYPDEVLAEFDVVIASIHSNLRMDEQKATERLIKAIENPYTNILGHPTGRLLLSREGYPIDHKAIIDACAEHRVCIELNANPYRLDLDWKWIPYAIEKQVPISINPDAHSVGGIRDIRYGVLAARKGGLTKVNCINALEAQDFLRWFR
ncbi:MAG: PHP domain-containing protein, partial [Bacteroidota bacterium]